MDEPLLLFFQQALPGLETKVVGPLLDPCQAPARCEMDDCRRLTPHVPGMAWEWQGMNLLVVSMQDVLIRGFAVGGTHTTIVLSGTAH